MMFKPHPYQRYCIERLENDPCVGLFLDMGLGKTAVTLTAINELKNNRWIIRKPLIIAPKKVAEATWQKEAGRWDHTRGLKFSAILGTAAQRGRALNTPADIYIVNRENVPWLTDQLRNDWDFDMVVLDESSSFKSHTAKRFRALRAVRPKISRLIELTGTPAPNGLIDLWAQLYLLDEGRRLGKTISSYREAFFKEDYRRPGQQFSTWSLRTGSEDRIRSAIGDICISMKAEDYLELPELIEDDIPVVLDTQAARDYKKLERDLLLEMSDGEIMAGTAAVLTNKLLQLGNGAAYGTDGAALHVHDCKLDAFMETVERLSGAHALVFYAFKHDLSRMQEALSKTCLRVRVYHGPEDETAWNAGEVDILLAHPASCAYGLNLQGGGHHVIWYGLTWSLELYEQANKRLHRQGQTQPVIIHHLLVQGGVDEDVIAALRAKGDTQAAMMKALKARIENYRRTK